MIRKLFRYGEIATPAMALLAENGDTKKLEIDMKSSSHNIRSVIKARFSIVWVKIKIICNLVSWIWTLLGALQHEALKFLVLVPL